MKIDVIIPIYKPGKALFALLDRLQGQTVPIQSIILMNTGKKNFERLVSESEFGEKYSNVIVHHLAKREFDHGGTRHQGVQYSHGDVFVMMTQDAWPVDSYLIEHLVKALKGKVAVAYARQVSAENAPEFEKISRGYNYPAKSQVKTAADLDRLGIKTFFCSNVCAAYRRDVYEESGGFIRHTIFNEDMIYAAGVIRAGYGVAYAAEAEVVHSHNYTNWMQLRRNFDLGVSQADHPEVFAGVASEAEGKKLAVAAWKYLRNRKCLCKFPGFCLQCGFKYAGYLMGRHYKSMPERLILRITMNQEYWKQGTNCRERQLRQSRNGGRNKGG